MTDAEVELAWRKGDPNFVGPVAAPMWLHQRSGKPEIWQLSGPLPGTINHPDVLASSRTDDAPFVDLATFDWEA